MRRLLAAGCLAAVVGVSCTNDGKSALQVQISVGAGVKAQCVRLVVRNPSGTQTNSGSALPVTPGDSLVVAVFPTAKLAREVVLIARGYVGADCSGEVSLNEESAPVRARFQEGTIVPVTVVLEGVPRSVDVDGDGYRSSAAGGVDCDDAHATVHPGAPELCDDGLDNDCDARRDCEAEACAQAACDDGDPCTRNETCSAGACVGGVPETCESSANVCHVVPGTCSPEAGGCVFDVRTGEACPEGLCRTDGVCVDETMEVDCGNGVDDDNNGLTDCADPDCQDIACDDGDLCTVNDTCQQGTCAPGAPKTCEQSANTCRAQSGTCRQQDGQCSFAPLAPGTPCAGGGECTAAAVCGPSETGALCANDTDDDGDGAIDCDDSSCLAAACNDQNVCTTDEVCTATAACGNGVPMACNQPPLCHAVPASGSTCDPKQGCAWQVTADAACPGGFCTAEGQCKAPFAYTPSNFNPLDYGPAVRQGPYTLNCGTVTFDTTPGAANGNWCGQAAPSAIAVTLSNGQQAAVLALKGLTLSGNSNVLRLIGTRPVILAVYGDVGIAGTIDAAGTGAAPGAGGDQACTGSTGAPGSNGTRGGGGGGGGFGTVGGGGGDGYGGSAGGHAGNIGGQATLVPLQGGCSGGAGGRNGGAGGGAGGAVQISASGKLTVTGRVHAGGGGGSGAQQSASGGGGGGSGGAILFEGLQIEIGNGAIVAANGGGGGEGKGPTNVGEFDGVSGTDGHATTPSPAAGGQGGTNRGGDGGEGAYATASPARDGQPGVEYLGDTGAGGGGGGGAGRIRVNAGQSCTVASGAQFRAPTTSNTANCP